MKLSFRGDSESIFLEEFSSSNCKDLWRSIFLDRENSERKNIWPGFNTYNDLSCYMKTCNNTGSDEYGYLIRQRSGEVLGTLHLFSFDFKNKTVEVGYGLHLKSTGRGYATRAVRLLLCCLKNYGFKEVFAECDDDNFKSWKVLERCGFKFIENYKGRRKYSVQLTYTDPVVEGREAGSVTGFCQEF